MTGDAATDSSRRRRVLLYTNTHLAGGLKGGMERHMELIAKHLDRSRFEVYGMVPAMPSLRAFAQSFATFTDHFASLTLDKDHLHHLPAFVRQLRDWRIDVLHLHNGNYDGQNLGVLAARLAGVRSVFVTEHQAPHEPQALRLRATRWVLGQMVAGIVCVSKHNFEGRSRYLYTPRGFIVDNGIDTDDFPPVSQQALAALRTEHQLPPDAQVVGTVVRFEEEKGLRYLIEAMPKVFAALPNAYLVMVGDGSLRAQLEQQVKDLGIASRVRFAGFQQDPRPYMGLMDVFVLPVPVGSMSIAVLEAMAMRCAVVITFGDEGEAVVHGQTGMRAGPRDADQIASCVHEILGTPGLRRRLGDAARQYIETNFSAATTARRLEAIYLGEARPATGSA